MKIERLKREEIDDKVWNGCVHYGRNGLPYGYTWYLDKICDEWEGLVWKDYKAVMPLVFNKKYGQSYLYQPLFAQQLGVFGVEPLKEEVVKAFLDAIPAEYKFIEIQVNAANGIEHPGFEWKPKTNLLLSLDADYEKIAEGYSKNLKRKLKKAGKANFRVRADVTVEAFVDFYEQHTASMVKEYQSKHKHVLHRLLYQAIQHSVGSIRCVVNEQNEIIAGNFFLFNKQRVINLLPASNDEGRDKEGMAFLMDLMIRSNCKSPRYFDFEGSEIPGVARFYNSFGATGETYYLLKRNNLPWPLRWFKK